jgi:hypothetical protein
VNPGNPPASVEQAEERSKPNAKTKFMENRSPCTTS